MVSSNLFLQFSSLIINVKAYFITCFSPKVMQKNVKNPTKDSEWVLRDSKCWTKALKIQVCYINCFINKKTEQKRYLMTTIGNKKKKRNVRYHFHLLISNLIFLYLLRKYMRLSDVLRMFRNMILRISGLQRYALLDWGKIDM